MRHDGGGRRNRHLLPGKARGPKLFRGEFEMHLVHGKTEGSRWHWRRVCYRLIRMERDIAQKLTTEFGQRITSERQVVYILVELRKLLDKNAMLYMPR
jgi:hypothetical protein